MTVEFSEGKCIITFTSRGMLWKNGGTKNIKAKGWGKCCEILSAVFRGSPELGHDLYTHELTCPVLVRDLA